MTMGGLCSLEHFRRVPAFGSFAWAAGFIFISGILAFSACSPAAVTRKPLVVRSIQPFASNLLVVGDRASRIGSSPEARIFCIMVRSKWDGR